MISLYIGGTSWAHRLSARFKLVTLFIISLLFIPFPQYWFSLGLLVLVLSAYASLGERGLLALKVVRPLLWIFGFILAFHVVLGSYAEGVAVVLRLFSMVLIANFVSITTPLEEMMDAVEPLFRPLGFFGVSTRRISLAVALVIRFIPVLLGLYASLQEAYFARTGKRNSWRLLAPFALHTLKMAEHVAEALTARGGAEGLPKRSGER
ncbi:energy-coupling factor transporter transmembrane protein EcfT [Rhodobacteraceae bacterium RKSG542]|uniref:energy-coupling factor transporter transmembrane component T family protein n=1 Tax=Pseudovibrio flavus TaxID=2529854 RepID=UPI0012BCB1F6|nr:energy-coupling factor transporter transmembrane protein EcfT [Pseudovibrio flavus]MTI16777.1 energy-coupling factor transporter transmembrane protein EcfT [Pseudovibrio flavus]